jgi:hypothetical protein
LDRPEISERSLRLIWQHRQFDARALQATDGRPVVVDFPGIPNHDGGPDFLDARIRIGPTLYCGDVEVHLLAQDWTIHRHHLDPHYNSVILHVALSPSPAPSRTLAGRTLPLLILAPGDPGIQERMSAVSLPLHQYSSVPCAGKTIPPAVSMNWFAHLGMKRLELKVLAMETRLCQLIDEGSELEDTRGSEKQPGSPAAFSHFDSVREFRSARAWKQLLYEGILDGLGYSKNRVPFRALAGNLPLTIVEQFDLEQTPTIIALLFGAAGLLPAPGTILDEESRKYVRELRRLWRDLSPRVRIPLLHQAQWQFFRLRPLNFPSARLATLAFLLPRLFGEGAFRRLMSVFDDPAHSPLTRYRMLRAMFCFAPDTFWAHHLCFGISYNRRGIALGSSRVNDIIVNTLIPFALIYARVFSRRAIEHNAILLYRTIPPLQRNTITVEIERQFLQDGTELSSARLHQGALHLYHTYCRVLRCGECRIAAFCSTRDAGRTGRGTGGRPPDNKRGEP